MAAVPSHIDDTEPQPEFGPAMRALPNDKWRNFVCALYEAPMKRGRVLWAARTAGIGKENSSNKSVGVMAARMLHDDRVQAAIAEESQRRLRAMPPEAIVALEAIIRDPAHKDHARGIAMVLDRTDPLQTTHTVKIEDTRPPSLEATQQVLDRIEKLMRGFGLIKPAAPVIEGECTVIDGAHA
jgi:hypothetical protein